MIVMLCAKGTISVENTGATDAAANSGNQLVIFKNYVPFTDCVSIINNAKRT